MIKQHENGDGMDGVYLTRHKKSSARTSISSCKSQRRFLCLLVFLIHSQQQHPTNHGRDNCKKTTTTTTTTLHPTFSCWRSFITGTEKRSNGSWHSCGRRCCKWKLTVLHARPILIRSYTIQQSTPMDTNSPADDEVWKTRSWRFYLQYSIKPAIRIVEQREA